MTDKLIHVIGENYNPGSGSALDDATMRAWQYFTYEREMPDDIVGSLRVDPVNPAVYWPASRLFTLIRWPVR